MATERVFRNVLELRRLPYRNAAALLLLGREREPRQDRACRQCRLPPQKLARERVSLRNKPASAAELSLIISSQDLSLIQFVTEHPIPPEQSCGICPRFCDGNGAAPLERSASRF